MHIRNKKNHWKCNIKHVKIEKGKFLIWGNNLPEGVIQQMQYKHF